MTEDAKTAAMDKIASAKKAVGSATGMDSAGEKKLEEWLGKVDDMQAAVKHLLSDEYKEPEVPAQPPTPAAPPAAPLHQKQRYSSDYSRFDRDDFTVTEPKKPKVPVPDFGKLPEKPDNTDPQKLTEYLCLKESLAYKERGNALFKEMKYKEAEAAYSSGITLNPANFTIKNNRAQARLKLEDWEGAVKDCDDVLGNEPDNMKAIKRRAVALTRLRRSEAAMKDIERAMRHEGRTKELRSLHEEASREIALERHVNAVDEDTKAQIQSELAAAKATIRALRTHGPPKPVSDDAATASSSLATLTTQLNVLKGSLQKTKSKGTRLYFAIWEGGAAELLGLVTDFKNCYLKQPALDKVSQGMDMAALEGAAEAVEWQLLVMAVCDLLCVAFESEDALVRSMELSPGLGEKMVQALVKSFYSEKAGAQASLKLLVAVTGCASGRTAARQNLTADDVMALPHHATATDDGSLALLLQLVDNLLKDEAWCTMLAVKPLPAYILPLMASTRSRGVRDSAAAAVMRLTTDPRFRASLTSSNLPLPVPRGGRESQASQWTALGERSQSVIHYLAAYLEAEALTMESPFAIEAILASLHNCLLEGPSVKADILSVLCEEHTMASCLQLIIGKAVLENKELANLRARALAVLSKAISVDQVHGLLKKEGKEAVLCLASFMDIAKEPTKLPKVKADTTDEHPDYSDVSVENAVSVLAAMLAKEATAGESKGYEVGGLDEYVWTTEPVWRILLEGVGAAMVAKLKKCLRTGDRTCGNAALVASELAKHEEWVAVFGKDLVLPLLDVIKSKRNERRDEEDHIHLLRRESATVASPSFKLNAQAQKNAAIALARLAKDPANRECLTANHGIEILRTTLSTTTDNP